MLCNELGKDAWICVPHKATDDYIRSLALLFRDGNEHTPGLSDTLKLYVEYSNEVWHTGNEAFNQTGWCWSQAASYGMPINYDGEGDGFTLMFRFKAMRALRMSEVFREVFGDNRMMSRVRPVIMWQQGYNDLTWRTLQFIDKWYNKRDSRSTVSVPHPVNYYFYGGGGTAYWNHDPTGGVTPTIDNIWTMGGMDAAQWEGGNMLNDANWCSVMGLRHLCYEGGAIEGGTLDETLRREANGDPRMRTNCFEHHKAFNHLGGDLLMYFNTTSDPTPGLSITTNVDDPRGPKYLGVMDALAATPEPISRGRLAPYDVPAGYFETMRWELDHEVDGPATITANEHALGYVFRVDQAGIYGIEVDYSTSAAARLCIDFEGREYQVLDLPSTSNATRTSSRVQVVCLPGVRYGYRLVGYQGVVSVKRVRVVLVSTAAARDGARRGARDMRVSMAGAGLGLTVTGLSGERPATAQLLTLAGSVVRSVTIPRDATSSTIDLRGTAPGALLLRVNDGRGESIQSVRIR